MPEAIAREVVDALRRRGWTLAVAESMTGGLLGATLTLVEGSSNVFRGGVIAYVDDVKIQHLGVDPGLLARGGAVGSEVACAMASGVLARFGSDLALSVTGFAGPGVPPGSEVGLVHVGVATRGRAAARELHLDGGREAVRRQAVEEALRMALAEAQRPA